MEVRKSHKNTGKSGVDVDEDEVNHDTRVGGFNDVVVNVLTHMECVTSPWKQERKRTPAVGDTCLTTGERHF